MKSYYLGMLSSLIAASLTGTCQAEVPVFTVTPVFLGASPIVAGETGASVYQVFNNTNQSLANIGLQKLPAGATYLPSAGDQYCGSTFTLAPGASCLIKILMNSNSYATIKSGPIVCFSATRPVYCSQPLASDQLDLTFMPGPIPQDCESNKTNFTHSLSQTFDTTPVTAGWGPARQPLPLSTANPNLAACTTTTPTNTTAVSRMQERVLAAEDYWVKQKLNYCHHHVTDWQTTPTVSGVPRSQVSSGGGFCSNATDIMPGSVYYNQMVRWNYSGQGSETKDNWVNRNRMWYGVDCSDFTSFVYNFAFGIQFNSDTGYQAGQASDGSQDNLFPNAQTALNKLGNFNNADPNSPAGVLVCKGGETEVENPNCGGYGTNGYFSAFVFPNSTPSRPSPTPSNITSEMLNYLHPGDLIYLGFAGSDGNNPTSMVTHVITWTGKKVGYGANDVNPNRIAPESICPQSDWTPQIGDWVIIDSHYQGPDYRVFSKCFYQNNVWGVRRVIGYMA